MTMYNMQSIWNVPAIHTLSSVIYVTNNKHPRSPLSYSLLEWIQRLPDLYENKMGWGSLGFINRESVLKKRNFLLASYIYRNIFGDFCYIKS